MLTFLDGLQEVSGEFIFKGGNLLWHYIKTPRETIDLDLATLSLNSHLEVKKSIEASLKLHEEIDYKIKEFKEINDGEGVGAAIIISYSTISNQKNQFSIDIVYALPIDVAKIQSSTKGREQLAASIENIICDKLSASHRFKSGNTRMKDFDDLWRISKSEIVINKERLHSLLKARGIHPHLENSWIEFLAEKWKRHAKSYSDIPKELAMVFNDINNWLKRITS